MLPFINAPFEYLETQMGVAPEPLKLVFTLILSYPLAGLLKRIPDAHPYQKNLFTIAVALFYLVGVFDLWAGIRTLFISSAGAYAISKYIQGPWMPWIGFVFLMGHMSVSHIHRHYVNNADIVDITGAQMVLVMKLSAFCWNVHDGRLPDEDLEEFQRDRAIKDLPSLLDYAGYVLFFPALMIGPAFDYVEYRRWLETSMFDLPPGTDPAKAPKTRKKRRIPRSGTPATMKALQGVFWIILFLKFSGWYYNDLLIGDESVKYGLLRRVFNMHMVNFTTRMKYYGVWFLAEGSCILSGIGYKGLNPKTGRPDWDRLQNVNPLGIELAQNSRAYLGNWNMNTNNWLRNYVYLRVTPKGKKPGFAASMSTFVTSAFWHGFEPGYYMTFVLAVFIQTVAKNTRRLLRPFFLHPTTSAPLPTKRIYDIASWAATQLAFSFCTTPFILLSLRDSTLAWQRVYFYCIIGVASGLGLFADASPVKRSLKKALAKRAGASGAQAKGKSGEKKGEDVGRKSEGAGETGMREQGRGMATGHDADDDTSSGPTQRHAPSTISPSDTASATNSGYNSDASTSASNLKFTRPSFLDRTGSSGYTAAKHGAMGVSDDPGRDLDELMEQVRAEVQMRRQRGMSIGQSLQEAVQSRWGSGVSAKVDGEGRVSVSVDGEERARVER